MSAAGSRWPEVSLGDVCEFKYGKSLPESARAGGDLPVFGSNGQVGNHGEALTAGPTIVVGRKGSFGEVHFSAGACWPIDTTYYVDGTGTKADLRWLAYRLAALGLNRLNRAAAVPGLNREDAYRQRLLLPPLPEQRRIAAILDKADALRAKRRAALAKLDTLTESIFLDMFGDPATNPKGWPTRRLDALVRESDSINYGVVQPGGYCEDGVPLIRVSDLQNGRIERSALKKISPSIESTYRRSRLRGDEILISCVGSTGVVAIADRSVKGFNVARAVARIPLSESVSRAFMATYLRTEFVQKYFRAELRTVSQPTLNIKQISETVVAVPPAELQRDFEVRAATLRQVGTSQRASSFELDALFASLQHRAFRGELTASDNSAASIDTVQAPTSC